MKPEIPASIVDIKRHADQIKDNWSLCNFWGNCEAEVMIAQTIHACVLNHAEHGEAFSFKGGNVNSIHNGGLVNNHRAYHQLIDQGMFIEDEFKSRTVIRPTHSLIQRLDEYFSRKT